MFKARKKISDFIKPYVKLFECLIKSGTGSEHKHGRRNIKIVLQYGKSFAVKSFIKYNGFKIIAGRDLIEQ